MCAYGITYVCFRVPIYTKFNLVVKRVHLCVCVVMLIYLKKKIHESDFRLKECYALFHTKDQRLSRSAKNARISHADFQGKQVTISATQSSLKSSLYLGISQIHLRSGEMITDFFFLDNICKKEIFTQARLRHASMKICVCNVVV